MSEVRMIKKYPNRRLYDAVESRYITLQDLRRLVIDRIEFRVIEKNSQRDITSIRCAGWKRVRVAPGSCPARHQRANRTAGC